MAHDGIPLATLIAPAPLAHDRVQPSPASCAERFTRYAPDAPRLAKLRQLTKRFAQVAVPGLFLSLASCGGNMEEPKVQFNPNPSSQYMVHIAFDKLPRPFDVIDALASYEIDDESCLPRNKFSGARRSPSGAISIPVEKISDKEVTVKFAKDELVDEDYYGLGICRWKFVGIVVRFRVNQLTFSTTTYSDDLADGHITKVYFPLRAFEKSEYSIDISASRTPSDLPDPQATFDATVRIERMSI
ncbi:hypothetical protein KR767_00985 [Luteibacter anthropi]|uniref:hypothetical protein n=1 Tax=Luteibacter anthropi TaxID=564369 RepID=UPI002032DF78|nr:hypothetical protein [Luteibacter anthropi]URX62686.1 hypothetical protein KR767_00985 [Luteibacter anthropi]